FLYYYLKSRSAYFNKIGTGTTIPYISRKKFEELSIPEIPLEEQANIVEILEKVERTIEHRKHEIEYLDTLIKARFVEMFGDPITNTKQLETRDLKDVLVLKAGDFTAASDILDEPTETHKYPCYGGNGIRGYVEEYNQEGEYSLVGRQGALSGNVQFARGQFKNTEHALLVTPIVEMNSIWLNQLLLNLDLKRYQTGAAQPGLSVKNLQEIQIIMVSIEEQNSFAEFVKQVDKSKVVA
ncbi:MAG: restriction endonuclease subunit S, partial [Butyrivibrio sp.]|nr:restriction endonuclease subunit S [Butyrivibrio sp.]